MRVGATTTGSPSTAAPDSVSRLVGRAVPARWRPRLAGAVRGLAYRGSAVECPCCGGAFRRFRPHRGRPDARCPRCGALERHRVLSLFLSDRTNLFTAPLSVLHVAPEYLLQKQLKRHPNLDYLSVDLDSPLAMRHADVTDLPFEADSFDVVLCNHVLEHVPDDHAAMRELRRVLRPEGWAIILSPVDHERATTYEDPSILTAEERLRAFEQEDHVRIYGRDYVERLRSAGFGVEVETYGDNDPAVARRHRLRRDGRIEEIYVCHKDAVPAVAPVSF